MPNYGLTSRPADMPNDFEGQKQYLLDRPEDGRLWKNTLEAAWRAQPHNQWDWFWEKYAPISFWDIWNSNWRSMLTLLAKHSVRPDVLESLWQAGRERLFIDHLCQRNQKDMAPEVIPFYKKALGYIETDDPNYKQELLRANKYTILLDRAQIDPQELAKELAKLKLQYSARSLAGIIRYLKGQTP